MTVHRTRPLPKAPAVGRLIVAAAVADRTAELLRDARTPEPPHEGMVWWLGREVDDDTLIVACHRPAVSSGPQFVHANESATGAAARLARAYRLVVTAQVHSHPGYDTRHSDGDDDLVLMPYPGMFSLVIADYGRGSVLPEEGAGLHQFQNGRWIQVAQDEPPLIIVPAEVVRD